MSGFEAAVMNTGGPNLQGPQLPQRANNPRGANQPQPGNNPRPPPQQLPQANDNPPHPPPPPRGGGATPGAWRALLLAALTLAALLWPLWLPLTCPVYMDQAFFPPARAASPRARYDGGTAMFTNALRWLGYYQGEAGIGGPSDTILTRRESATIAEYTEDLASGVLGMEDAFASGNMFEARELDALEARLYRARDEVSYFADATWPRLARLACLPCGYFPLTLSCPSHPIDIARREVEAVTKVLLLIDRKHWGVLKRHEGVQAEALDPAHDGVCRVSERFSNVNPKGGSLRRMRRLLDFQSAAFGVCSLTWREQDKAIRFREREAYVFKDELETLRDMVNKISSNLDKAHVSRSWGRENIDVGVKAVGELLDVLGGLR